MKNITDYIQQWANTYKDDMLNNIMPFWIKYGLDRVNGGIY
ncbi:N-acylglucosamine 2-epimerase, partial [Bacteroides ovatus]